MGLSEQKDERAREAAEAIRDYILAIQVRPDRPIYDKAFEDLVDALRNMQ